VNSFYPPTIEQKVNNYNRYIPAFQRATDGPVEFDNGFKNKNNDEN